MHSPATLVFVRHAEADCSRNGQTLLCGRHDAPLSPLGRRQVDLLRRRLIAGERLDAVFASPLRRAVETAQAAPEPTRSTTRTLRSLAEIDCGAVDGLALEEVRQRYPAVWLENESQTNENFAWPGGETYRAFRRRVLRAIDRIARLHAGQHVLVVTHAGVINQVLGTIARQSAAKWSSPRPRNASITRVLWENGSGQVDCFDDCTHLQEP